MLLPSAHAVDREYRVISALADTDVPVARALRAVRRRVGDRHRVLRDGLRGRPRPLGPALPELTPAAARARIYDELEPRDRRAAQASTPQPSASPTTASPATTSSARSRAGPSSTRPPRPKRIDAVDRLIDWLPEHIPPGDESAHRAWRLPLRQRDLPPHRAAHPRGARLGAVDARPSAGRLRLPLHDVAHAARRAARAAWPAPISPRSASRRSRVSAHVPAAHRPRPSTA